MHEKIMLSDGEWKLMRKLWERESATITELVRCLKDETGWSKHTVITMLTRLEKKGAVEYKEGIRAKQYIPLIAYEEAANDEMENFMAKVYGGSIGLMLSSIVGKKRITPEEIEELYTILKEAEDNKRKKEKA